MGLGDIVARTLIQVKADTSDAKRALKDLSATEKQIAQQRIADAEKTNKSLDGYVAMLGHVGLALQTVGMVTDFVSSSMKSYSERVRLETAAAGINIAKLSDSFHGLLSQHELLTFAAKTANGALHLTQEQMGTLAEAAVALRGRGFDLEDALNKLTDAAVKGKTEGLDDLGLSITQGASKAQTLKNMMTELNKVISESGPVADGGADAITRLGKAWDNAKEDAKSFVAEGLVSAYDWIGKIGDALNGNFQDWERSPFAKFTNQMEAIAHPERYDALAAARKGMVTGIKRAQDDATIEMPDMDLSGDRDARSSKRQEAAKREAERLRALANKTALDLTDALIKQLDDEAAKSNTERLSASIAGSISLPTDKSALDGILNRERGAMNSDLYNEYNDNQNQLKLETLFGPIEEFDAYNESLKALGDTFGAFTDAVGAGYEALVSGKGSVIGAIKAAASARLMATGKEAAIDALRETALGFGSLALGPLGGVSAAAHFKAAALHGAVAVAAGVAANALGGGGGNSPAGSSSGGGSSVNGGRPTNNNDSTPTHTSIIVYGDNYAEDSPRMRQLRAERLVKQAIGSSSVDHS